MPDNQTPPPKKLGFWNLCHEALTVCAANAIPLLKMAFVGYALAGVMGNLLGAMTSFGRLARGAGGFAGPEQYILQGVVGLMAMPLANGTITLLALGNRKPIRETFRHWPALIFVSLGYGAVVFVGVLVVANFLRAAQFDLSNIGRVPLSLPYLARAVAIRASGYHLLPDPGAPFGDALSYARALVRRGAVTYSGSVAYYSPDAGELALPAAGVFAALIVFETLLRLRFPALMRAGVPLPRALAECARTGARNFGRIATYTWALRFLFALAMALFVWLPVTVVQSVALPAFTRAFGGFGVNTVLNALSLAAVLLITMMFYAFSAVFDALLWAKLTGSSSA